MNQVCRNLKSVHPINPLNCSGILSLAVGKNLSEGDSYNRELFERL